MDMKLVSSQFFFFCSAPGRHTGNHRHLAEMQTEARGFSSGAEAPECETALLRAGFNLILAD